MRFICPSFPFSTVMLEAGLPSTCSHGVRSSQAECPGKVYLVTTLNCLCLSALTSGIGACKKARWLCNLFLRVLRGSAVWCWRCGASSRANLPKFFPFSAWTKWFAMEPAPAPAPSQQPLKVNATAAHLSCCIVSALSTFGVSSLIFFLLLSPSSGYVGCARTQP